MADGARYFRAEKGSEMKVRAPMRLNALCVARLIRYMQDIPSTVCDLAEHTGLAPSTTRRFLIALAREGAVYVSGWEPDRLGRYTTKVFSLGQAKDAKRPKPIQSLAQRRSERARRTRLNKPLILLAA